MLDRPVNPMDFFRCYTDFCGMVGSSERQTLFHVFFKAPEILRCSFKHHESSRAGLVSDEICALLVIAFTLLLVSGNGIFVFNVSPVYPH